MQVTVLGSGTSVPHPRRRPPAFLVQDQSHSLLIDAGAGCCTTLAASGVSLGALGGLALTHLHPDHTADLVPLLFALHNPLGPARAHDLRIWGPEGTAAHLAALARVYGRWMEPREARVVVAELGALDSFALGSLRVTAYGVDHHGACFAYRIEAGDRVVCLSGDTRPCAGLHEAASAADLLICECAALEDETAPSHMSATAVGLLAAAAGCGRLLLTHLYEHIERTDPASRVRAHYSGPVELAKDLMRVTV